MIIPKRGLGLTSFAERLLKIGVVLFAMVGAYQNCGGKEDQFANVQAAEEAQFFSYPYTSAPTYYWDIGLYLPATGTPSTLSEFQVVAAIRDQNDLSASTPYQIEITATDGKTLLCPNQQGTATPKVTTVSFNCVSSHPNVTGAVVKMTLGKAGSQQVVSKVFQL